LRQNRSGEHSPLCITSFAVAQILPANLPKLPVGKLAVGLSNRNATNFDGKDCALGRNEANGVMTTVHSRVADGAEENSRQNHFPECKYLTARNNATETHDDSSGRVGTEGSLRKPVILCVDDTPSILEGQKILLEENGYRALTATNGKEALRVFVENSVDLVLLDYHMPVMNGGVAAARMKVSKPDVPVALLSGDEHLAASDLEAVDCFIPKGASISSVLEKVDYLLSLRFLFRPLGALKAQDIGGRVNTREAEPESDRPNGISIRNEGIPKAL
jgi:CheY-like chemotaxis protein